MQIKILIEAKDSKEGWFKKYPIDVSIECNDCIPAMLCGINNKYDIETIFDPVIDRVRGIPVDSSPEYLTMVKNNDGVHHSYYYLRELKDLEKRGYWKNIVELDAYEMDTHKIYKIDTYKNIGKELYDLIKELEKIEVEKKICHNCIRMCFFFEDD